MRRRRTSHGQVIAGLISALVACGSLVVVAPDPSAAEAEIPTLSFDSTTSPGVGEIRDISVGNLNGDSIPDLLSIGRTNASVHLGNGLGGFSVSISNLMPDGDQLAWGGAIADLDHDGRNDLLVTALRDDVVWVFMGDGSGGFNGAPGSPYPVGGDATPEDVAVGDLDGDGDLDAVTANSGTDGISVLLGNGTGVLGDGTPIAAGDGVFDVAVGRIDAGTDLDIATPNVGGANVSVLLGGPDASFSHASGSPFPGGDHPTGIDLGDLNGDGRTDIAVANQVTRDLTVLLGNGAGGMTPAPGSPYPLGAAAFEVDVHDIDEDGIDDAAVAVTNANRVAIFLGRDAGPLVQALGTPLSLPNNSLPRAVAVADLNLDGKPDIVVGTSLTSTIVAFTSRETLRIVRNGTGTGVVASAPEIDCGATCSATYSKGTSVTLTAAADPGSAFTGWAGCDESAGMQCTVKMTRDRNVGATFADITPPDTLIDDGPSGPTADATPTFAFSSTEEGSTFQCRVDDDAFALCESAHTTGLLSDGPHGFEVRAVDGAGNTDPSPAARTFSVDTTPPESTITAGPGNPTDDATPTFEFSADEPGSRFDCSLDSAVFAPCQSPFTTPPLSSGDQGDHSFAVRATDPVGNTEVTPSVRQFVVRDATKLVAEPATLKIRPLLTVQVSARATLTNARTGEPLAGRPVVFRVRGAQEICTATTDSRGVASCTGVGALLLVLQNLGYQATFAGDPWHGPSVAQGPIIRVG